MKSSPFQYGTTVSDRSFTNREAEIRKLKQNLLQGIHTTIISPRRWGKSSLVEKVAADLRKTRKTRVVMIDLFTCGSSRDFLEIFAREVIRASSNKWQDWMRLVRETFKRVIPKVSMGTDPYTDFSISFDIESVARHGDEILNLPETIAAGRNIRMIVCVDEFQHLAAFPDYEDLERSMRAVWQRQKHVSYCLYGSKRHMMTDIFNNSSKPFYRFGDILLLERIRKETWTKFLVYRFADSGKKLDAALAVTLVDRMQCHSWYVQQLAHYTWNNSPKVVTEERLNRALDELIRANSPFFMKTVESLSKTQLNLLKAVVRGELQLTSKRVMQDYQLGTPRNVSKNVAKLTEEDILDSSTSGYEFLDPVFSLWFRWQYFGEDYLI